MSDRRIYNTIERKSLQETSINHLNLDWFWNSIPLTVDVGNSEGVTMVTTSGKHKKKGHSYCRQITKLRFSAEINSFAARPTQFNVK